MPIYSDLNPYYPTTKPLLTQIESVYQSIYNILFTRKGERIFNARFGSDLTDSLFDLGDDASSFDLLSTVTEAVEDNDPRVVIDFARSTASPDLDNNKIELVLYFQILGVDDQNFELKGTITR